MADRATVFFSRVAPPLEIGRVTFTENGELVPEGAGHVYLNTWKLTGGSSSEFVEYYSNWSNGKVRSSVDKASINAHN